MEPIGPGSALADSEQAILVGLSMALEVGTQVERPGEQVPGAQQECDEKVGVRQVMRKALQLPQRAGCIGQVVDEGRGPR